MAKKTRKMIFSVGALFALLFAFSLIALSCFASSDVALKESGGISSSFGFAFAILFNGVSFVGGLLYLSKKYMSKVDSLAETTPAIVATLKTIQQSLVRMDEKHDHHFKMLSVHANKITAIETTHRIRGCDRMRRSTDEQKGNCSDG